MHAADTSPEAAEVQRQIWRSMPDDQRLRRVLQWSSFAKRLAMEGIKARHPEYTDRQVMLAWFRQCLTDAEYRQYFADEIVEP